MKNSDKHWGLGAPSPLMFCKACASPLVQATDWAQQLPPGSADGLASSEDSFPSQEDDLSRRWHVRVWCPECGFEREAFLCSAEAAVLSRAVENGFASLLYALTELQAQEEHESADLDLVERLWLEGHTPGTR